MTQTPFSEVDLLCVAHAGDWHAVAGASEDELALAGACAALEAELRRRGWAAFETVLPHIVDGMVEPPADGPERIKVLAAVVELGWHYSVPAGEV